MTPSTNPTLHDARYRKSYRAMLEGLEVSKGWIKDPLCSLWPAAGKRYGSDLRVLLAGRAVNGWDVPSDPLRDGIDTALSAARAEAESGLDWVAEFRGSGKPYNTNRSQFWMTGGAMLCELIAGLDLTNNAWIDHLAWTNLARVAPKEKGNPSALLWNAQEAAGRALLELELELLRPDVVVAFTGWDWLEPVAPAGLAEGLSGPSGLPRHFHRVGRDRASRAWIVTRHPQGAEGGRAAYVEGLRVVMREQRDVFSFAKTF